MPPNIDEYIDYEAYYLQHVAQASVTGGQLTGLCPFHDDHAASFGVDLATGKWLCRTGCGKGNVISFHARKMDCGTKEAYRQLCEQYGIEKGRYGSENKKTSEESKRKRGRPRKEASPPTTSSSPTDRGTSPIVSKDAIPVEVLDLFKTIPQVVRDFLINKRGWSEEIIKKYHIGYNAKKISTPGHLEGERITIPIFTPTGDLVNIRCYKPGEKERKVVSFSTGSKYKGDYVSYGEARLFPEPILDEKSSELIILTEGEPDCLCGLSHGLACITQTAGCDTWKDSFNNAFKGRRVVICYDNDDAGSNGSKRVAKHLPHFAASVEIIQWPDWMENKEDLTDWFMKYGKSVDELLALPRILCEQPDGPSGEPVAGGDPEVRIDELNRTHSVLMLSGKCVVMNEFIDPVFGRPDIDFSSVNDFRNYYANERYWVGSNGTSRATGIGKLWFESEKRRQYKGIVFAPGEEKPGYYNLFRGFSVEPRQGEWNHFRDHIFNVIAGRDKETFLYILGWIAQLVQHPGSDRPGTSIVLRGEQGTGKGCFVTNIGACFGPHFLHITNQNQITGRFNNHLKDALLVFCDEGIWAGDKSAEGVLKGMITEDRIAIEPKGKDVYTVKNHIRLIIASNNNWVVPAGIEERRFFTIDVSNEHIQDKDYFKTIYHQMDNGGREAMLYDLMHVDLSGVNLRDFPRREALFDQIVHSMTTVQKFWLERLRQGSLLASEDDWGEGIVPTHRFHSEYLEFCKNVGDRYPVIDEIFTKEIRRSCPSILRLRISINGKRPWCLRFPDLWECREYFESLLRIKINWDEEKII